MGVCSALPGDSLERQLCVLQGKVMHCAQWAPQHTVGAQQVRVKGWTWSSPGNLSADPYGYATG